LNRKRREILKTANVHLTEAKRLVERAQEQEADALDSMPENMTDTDRYEKMENAADLLEDAVSDIEEAMEKIQEAAQ
jgi:poly-gamma-glutamate capsule biosynthesis protein CapA/YwtB (metallophosphatase superfamily)